MGFSEKDKKTIYTIAEVARFRLQSKYQGNLMGRCIEATDDLVEIYNSVGFQAKAKQVWCLYEYFESCSNYCYEEHWLVELINGKEKLYIDITLDQFQWAFTKKLPELYMQNKLPKFLLTRKPGKTTLDKCGWNDWYRYGNYVNNFEYY